MKTFKTAKLCFAGMLLPLALAGCYAEMSGGGWMDSALVNIDGDAIGVANFEGEIPKATFGFNFTCDQVDYDTIAIQGHVTYHDHGSTYYAKGKTRALAFQAALPRMELEGICSPAWYYKYPEYLFGAYEGEYTPIPPNAGPGGTFEFLAADSGMTGPDKMDFISIELYGGVLGGYENSGTPGGGNVNVP